MAVTPAKRVTRTRSKPKKYDIEKTIDSDDENYPDFDSLNLSTPSDDEAPENASNARPRRLRQSKNFHRSVVEEEPDFFPVTSSPAKRNRATTRARNQSKTPLATVASIDIPNVDFATGICSLYESLSSSDCIIRSLCDDWIENFQQQPTRSIHELLALIFNASGCKFLTLDAFTESMDNCIDALDLLEKQVSSNPSLLLKEHRFEAKTKEARRFIKNFHEFWSALVEHLFATILQEDSFLPVFLSWVSTVTTSHFRSVRHVSTVAVLSLMSGFCQSVQKYKRQLEVTQKIKNSATKKKSRSKVNTVDEEYIVTGISYCQEMIDQNFNAVFVHRQRDVDYKIRAECVSYLGQWCDILPEKFLDDSYLRHLSDHLADPKPLVREAAIRVIKAVFDYPEHRLVLKPFIEVCQPSFIEIALFDAKESIKVSALALITDILSSSMFVVSEWMGNLKYLIFHASVKVRQSAAKVVELHLKETSSLTLDGFCQFLIETERENSCDIVFDLFHSNFGQIFSHQNLIASLLNENRNERFVEFYFEFLICLLKNRKNDSTTKVENATFVDSSLLSENSITESTINHSSGLVFSQLVQIFQANKAFPRYFLQLAQNVDVNILVENMDAFRDSLLLEIFEIIERASDPNLVNLGVEVLYYLKSTPVLSMEIDSVIDQFLNGTTGSVMKFINEINDAWSDLDFDPILNSMRVIECILSNAFLDVEFLFPFLERLFTNIELSEEYEDFLVCCLNCLFKFIIYDGEKSYSSIFVDVCSLALNCSLANVSRKACYVLIDYFIFSQTTSPLLTERIMQILVESFVGEISIDELFKNASCFSKLLIFRLCPLQSHLSHLLAIACNNDKIEVLLNCVLKKLLEHTELSTVVIEDAFIGLEHLFTADKQMGLSRAESVADLFSKHVAADFSYKQYHERVIGKILETKQCSLFELYAPFVKNLTRNDAAELISIVEQAFSESTELFASKQELDYYENYHNLLKSRSRAKPGRKARSADEPESMMTSVADLQTDGHDTEVLPGENYDENPFASSPKLS